MIKSGFFNSVDRDRLYDAEDLGNYFDGVISDGIFETIGNRLAVTPGEGMRVNIDTGRAMVKCHWMVNTTIHSLKLAPADVQYKRIDRIVIRLDKSDSARTVDIAVLQGVGSLNPVAPELTRTSTVWELCIADVLINPNVVSISQSNITDQRLNTALCGFVTGVVKQVDTSDLAIQYQTAFSEFYNQATEEFNNYYSESREKFDAFYEESSKEFDEYYESSSSEFDTWKQEKKTAYEAWFNGLTDSLNVNTTLVKYQNTVTLTAETTSLSMGVDRYATGDIVIVCINGFMLNDNEFSVSGEGSGATVTFANALDPDNDVTITVIKSVIGDAAIYS